MQNIDVFRLDGHTLRVFLTVCDTGSVSRTADVFDLNQSTISHTLERMRSAVGDPLFVKSGRGITPTDKAMSLIPKVQDILARIEGLVAIGDYDPAQETNPIVVGVPTPSLMPQMKAMYSIVSNEAPRAPFHASRLAPRERMAEMLTVAEIDVGISINMAKYPATLSWTPYLTDQLAIFYDPERRGPVETVEQYANAGHGVAGLGGTAKSIVQVALEQVGLQRHIAFAAPTSSTLGEFLKGTDLIATMPLRLAESAFGGLAHCPPPLVLPDLRYDLVWHKRFEHSGRNAWIRQALLRAAA